MSSWRKLAALLACTLLVFGVAACGDDDDDEAAVGDDTTETTGAEDGEGEGEGEGDGPPDVNPCAEGVDPAEAGLPPAEEPAEGATAVTVTAVDYDFQGAEALAAGGQFAITLENDGDELHEMVIMAIDATETRTVEEMLQAEEEPDTVSEVAFGFACPGESTVFNADLTQPGRYVAVCFIPTGTLPETDPADFPEDAPPHAAQGMVAEWEVAAS